MNIDSQKHTPFYFRDLHPHVSLGTASDRYAGWLGQIYTAERYNGRITRRKKTLNKKTFIEEVLPVDSLEEFFDHFKILELDFTFYSLLTDATGKPTPTFHILRKYKQHLKKGDHLILKAPQLICAQKIRRGKTYIKNETYLDPEIFRHGFYEPAKALLDPWLSGIVFEQEYQRKQERVPLQQFSDELDRFFSAVPKDTRFHMELRTPTYLSKPVFDVFEKHGIGQVLSHWTWLPPPSRQFSLSGQRIFNSAKAGIIRLMTPQGMRYEDAYARAHPFNRLVTDMMKQGAVSETVQLIRTIINKDADAYVIINNRYGGNAPLVAQKISEQFLQVSG